jgi:hypothetical protein
MVQRPASGRIMFVNYDRIICPMTTRPNGNRTATESAGHVSRDSIKEHVMSSNRQVEAGSDPGLPIESDALHAIFENCDKVRTTNRDYRGRHRRQPDIR